MADHDGIANDPAGPQAGSVVVVEGLPASDADSGQRTGFNPRRPKAPSFMSADVPALAFAAVAAGVFVVAAVVAFGVLSLAL